MPVNSSVPQKLIDILKDVETFIIKDKVKISNLVYCIPRKLSKSARQIYTVFKKEYPKRPYKLEGGCNTKNQ